MAKKVAQKTRKRYTPTTTQLKMDIIAYHLEHNYSYCETAKHFNTHPQTVKRIVENEEMMKSFWDKIAQQRYERAQALKEDNTEGSIAVVYTETLNELSRRLLNADTRGEIATKDLITTLKALHPILHPDGNNNNPADNNNAVNNTKSYFSQFKTFS